MTPEIGSIFRYGFLASSVSRLIAIYRSQPTYRLSMENRDLLKRAGLYMDDILNSQQLVSGLQGQRTPSAHGLKAFKHALNSLQGFSTEAFNSSVKRKEMFEGIRSVLQGMVDKQKTELDPEELNVANIFFGAMANQYLNEAQHRFRSQSFSRPK